MLGSDQNDTLVCRLNERGDFPGKPIGLVQIHEVSAVLEFEIARYNDERPHEALGDATPASCYAPSPRPYRSRLEPLVYPSHYERRLVSRNGGVRWKHRWVNASHLFAELEIGFEEIDDGLWNVYFGPVWLGRFHEEVGRIVDQLGRPIRRRGDNHKGRTDRKVLPIT
jgi:hypothetical protein